MGKRGPRPDPHQEAKGYPSRRKTKADKAAEEAARLAKLLAPLMGPVAELPAMLQDPKYAPAAVVWKRMAPELRRTHRLPPESEFHFVQWCIYAQEWTSATEDLHANGFTQSIQTVAGGKMERRRPRSFDRQQAYSNLMELSSRFGLTPHDMYSLFKDQALAAASNPGLFGEDRRGPTQPAPQTEADEDAELETPAPMRRIGGFGQLKAARALPKPN